MIIFGQWPPSWSAVAAAAALTGAVILASAFGVVIALAFVAIIVVLMLWARLR